MPDPRASELSAMRISVDQLATSVELLRRDLRLMETRQKQTVPPRTIVAAPAAAAAPPTAPPARMESAPAVHAPVVPAPVVRVPEMHAPAHRTITLRDVETLVGRYGSIALAAVSIVAGVAVFLGWAIRHGVLGPEVRVGLGALVAGALAAAGVRFRRQGSTRFGGALLTLALAVVHADAWGAGPRLHVVPSLIAFIVAAAASELLVLTAVRDDDQFLFCVGVGGALLAPFLTWDSAGTLTLLAYGWTVLATAIRATRSRSWSVADALVLAGCSVYATTAVWRIDPASVGALTLAGPALLGLGCAWTMLAGGARARSARTALGHLSVALVALFAFPHVGLRGGVPFLAVLALAGTVTTYLVPASGYFTVGSWKSAMIYAPLLWMTAALASLPETFSATGAAVAGAWAAAAIAAARRAGTRRRGPHVATAALTSAIALVIALHDRPAACAAALALHATLSMLLLRWVDARALLITATGVLVCASTVALALLRGDAPFESLPFGDGGSVAALLSALGWWAVAASPYVARILTRERITRGEGDRRMLYAFAALYTFWWWRLELAGAFSPDAATFLLVVYYAAAGVAAVGLGRRAGNAPVRRAGLSVAMYAGAKALVQASLLAMIGLRVGTYLLAGGFLLFVAYWYRAHEEA